MSPLTANLPRGLLEHSRRRRRDGRHHYDDPVVWGLPGDLRRTAPCPGFQLAFYDLAEALRPMCGDPGDAEFVEPRHAAVTLLAADLTGYRPDLATPIGDWLDLEVRGVLTTVLRSPAEQSTSPESSDDAGP